MKPPITPEEAYLTATTTHAAAPFTKAEAAAMFCVLEKRLADRIPATGQDGSKLVTRAILARHFSCGTERIATALQRAGVTGTKVGYATRYPFAATCERIAPYLSRPLERFSS
jgi:hypothetical protein